ncbi:low molecular weight protein-tyrosine-phosphatase [Saccharospirillum sp. HFRX-1]|uniref:low molecular weight protein-tyrosine-phosphatase n=1 Tax=unclassified Saccharospirillum TaxID=2633430 RepID=UPI00370FE54F
MSDTSVLFVCLGNICRSPTAQGVFEHVLAESALAGKVSVDSAGTAAYHLGKAPDARATAAARQRGYRLEDLRARQVSVDDFYRFDWILAMDTQNLADLQAIRPADGRAQLGLFLEQLEQPSVREVPDPYYGGDEGFEQVLDLCETASRALLRRLEAQL